jgi:hypothetical protein
MNIADLENQLRQILPPVEPRAEFVAGLGRQLKRGVAGPQPERQNTRWWWVLAGVGGASIIFLGFRLVALLVRRASGLVPTQAAQLRS